ncbi:MAG: hypothetical protein ACJAYB_002611 [Psychromonas sp.]|jgi:hypothetical protein
MVASCQECIDTFAFELNFMYGLPWKAIFFVFFMYWRLDMHTKTYFKSEVFENNIFF